MKRSKFMANEFGLNLILVLLCAVALFVVVLNVYATTVPQGWILYTNGSSVQDILSANLKEADNVVIDYSKDGTDKSAFKSEDIQLLKNAGKKVFCYMNFAVAEDWRFYWKYIDKSIILGPLESWPGEYYVKFWYVEWYKVITDYMKRILSARFDGVALDWINIYENDALQKLTGKSLNNLKYAMVENIKKVTNDFPNLEYALVNGEDILLEFPELQKKIRYVIVESLFFNNSILVTNTKSYIQRLGKLLELVKSGITILSVEYIDNGNPFDVKNAERIKTYLELSKKYGFKHYIARIDMKLNVVNIPQIPK
jgi:cysteinyl-tRNA synthetase